LPPIELNARNPITRIGNSRLTPERPELLGAGELTLSATGTTVPVEAS